MLTKVPDVQKTEKHLPPRAIASCGASHCFLWGAPLLVIASHLESALCGSLRQGRVGVPFLRSVLHHPVFGDTVFRFAAAEVVAFEHGGERLFRLQVRLRASVQAHHREEVRGGIPFGVQVAGPGGAEVEEEVYDEKEKRNQKI